MKKRMQFGLATLVLLLISTFAIGSTLEWINVKDAPYNATGDGTTNDTLAIQSAIDAVTSDAVIVFPPGKYLHNTLNIADKTNVTFLGYGAVSVGTGFGVNHAMIFETCAGIKVMGFKFDRNASGEMQNNSAIVFGGCVNCEAAQNEFYDVRYGVSVNNDADTGTIDSKRVIIRHNTMSNRVDVNTGNTGSLGNGSLPQWLALISDGSEDTLVTGNQVTGGILATSQPGTMRTTVTDNFSAQAESSVIYFSGCTGCIASGNTILEAGKDAIKVINFSKDVVISNNRIAGAGATITNSPNLIQVSNSENATIVGNQLTMTENGAQQSAILIIASTDVVVDGNAISSTATTGNDQHAIQVRDNGSAGAETTSRITITDNRMVGLRGMGIWVTAFSGMNVEDLHIADNHIVGTSGVTNFCIDVGASNGNSKISRIRVLNNTCDTYKVGGISLRGIGEITDVQIIGNRIINADSVNSDAIYIVDNTYSGHNVIEGNTSDASEFLNGADYGGFFFFVDPSDRDSFIVRNNSQAGASIDVVINQGAIGTQIETLPAAVVGMERTFVRVANQAIRIEPYVSETIGSGGAGKYLEMQSNGSRVHLKSYVTGAWVVESASGTIDYEP